jgi:hypothetical protein
LLNYAGNTSAHWQTFIRAMGGKVEIVAHFPQGTVRITQLQDVKGRPAQEHVAE